MQFTSPPLPLAYARGNDMHDAMKRREIEILHKAGLSIRQVARKAGVSRNAVRRILRDQGLPEAADSLVGRPPIAEPYEGHARQILEERPDLPTVEILRLLRLQGYRGGKNPVYQLVRRLRKTVRPPPLVLFDGLAGEFSQNDFGAIRVRYENGTTEVLHFFAARLKWSRWVYVEIVPNEREEALIRALLNSFQSFGGVPLLCVFDNPKTIVLSRYGNAIQWNPTFAQVATDYRFAIELCTPRRGQEKGAVENLVGFVKKNFFLPRQFHDREDLLAQLPQWHHEVNYERPCRATKEIPAARIEAERSRLRPLPLPPSEYPLRFPVRVGPMATVTFQGMIYSMPAETVNHSATLYLYPDRVRIMTDKHDEVHPRWPPNGKSMLPSHVTSHLAALMGRRADLYYKRQRLLEVGPAAEEFLTNLVHAHPRTWPGDVKALFELWLEHGPERMAEAFQEALSHGWFASEPVEHWLKRRVTA